MKPAARRAAAVMLAALTASCAVAPPEPQPDAEPTDDAVAGSPGSEAGPRPALADPEDRAAEDTGADSSSRPPESDTGTPETKPETTPETTPQTTSATPEPAAEPEPRAAADPSTDTDEREHAVTAVRDLCEELGGLLGSVSIEECHDSRLSTDLGWSVSGRPIALRDFPSDAAAPRVLVIGGLHGDEYSSVSIVFRWIERLGRLNPPHRHWRLIPSANPDGLLSARPAVRTNARGVDLNRNFPTPDWEQTARNYWQAETGSDPRRYPGSAAGSESETRWLVNMIARWNPDVIVAVHAPHALLDFDNPPQGSLVAPTRLGSLFHQPLGTYPGSLGRYGRDVADVPVLTLELPWAGIMPSPEEQERLWGDLLAWLDRYLPTAPAASSISSSSS